MIKKISLAAVILVSVYFLFGWINSTFLSSDEEKIRQIIVNGDEAFERKSFSSVFSDFSDDFVYGSNTQLRMIKGGVWQLFRNNDGFRVEVEEKSLKIIESNAEFECIIHIYPIKNGKEKNDIFGKYAKTNPVFVLFEKNGNDWEIIKAKKESFKIE